ncbi:MAG: S-layer homology domain-containing protein [Desulfosporosinus sp.]|nr:S-layer homology domain-containing protein [Desulfosporosinus sp.]
MNFFVVLLLLLQLAVSPANVLGSDLSNKALKTTPASSTITVEQAVQAVKNNFTIPEQYTQLSTGYNNFDNRATYSLNWNALDQPGGSFNAEVDAATGDIVNVNQWEGPLPQAFKLPVLSADEAETIATALITKLASKHLPEMQLVKDQQQVLALNNAQPFTYNFRWIRIVNGIQFPGNGVSVSVSGDDGQIRNYNYNWTQDLVFPEAANIISPEKARQVFADTPMIELQYFLPQIMNPQTTSEPQRALLVYQLANSYSGGAIDALTGKPVTLDPKVGYRSLNVATTTGFSVGTVAMTTSAVSNVQTAADNTLDNSQQISQDKAVDVVKNMIEIPSELVLRNSSLNKDWQNPSQQVWNLDWYNESPTMGENHYLNARVSAKTGDFIGFSMSNATNSGDKSNALTREGAQKLAEDFLKRVQPERFKLVKMGADNFYGGKMPGNIQSFNYTRVVNDIPVSNNGMTITVDTVAKQVINYNLNWSDVEFPSPSEVLPLNQVIDQFLKMRPLALNYSLIPQQNGQQEVRLVYQPNPDYNMYIPAILDAKTGDPMDWYGKSQSEWLTSHNYTDIQGNYAEKEIGIMGLTGAFGEYGETFHPDEKITVGSFLRAMLTAEGTNRDRVLTDEDVLKLAKERGWVHDDLKLSSELSREDLSKVMIRLINMEPSAQVKDIYALPFTDAKTIQPDSLGYIALAWGLGILKIDGDTLQPKQSVTRADAAYALVHAYAVERPLNAYLR